LLMSGTTSFQCGSVMLDPLNLQARLGNYYLLGGDNILGMTFGTKLALSSGSGRTYTSHSGSTTREERSLAIRNSSAQGRGPFGPLFFVVCVIP